MRMQPKEKPKKYIPIKIEPVPFSDLLLAYVLATTGSVGYASPFFFRMLVSTLMGTHSTGSGQALSGEKMKDDELSKFGVVH